MSARKSFKSLILCIILSLVSMQSIHAGNQAEYESYLPLVQRSSFVPSIGTPDNDFGWSGATSDSLSADSGAGQAIAQQPDGKLVVAGSLEVGVDDNAFLLARYNPDGSLDTSFDGDGWLTTNLSPGNDALFAVALPEDGKILVAGSTESSGESEFALARYTADGNLDTSFDGDGWLITDFGEGEGAATSLALQPDGKIVAAGFAQSPFIPYDNDIAAARYLPGGSLDASFSDDGTLLVNYSNTSEVGNSIALQPDGNLVLAGTVITTGIGWSEYAWIVLRINPDGSLDNTFGELGQVTTDFYDGGGPESATGILLQPDGKILAVGWANNNTSGLKVFALARYNQDGSLDTSFDEDGMAVSILSFDDYFGEAVELLPDGKILLAGSVNYVMNTDYESAFILARFTSGGALDTSFGSQGLVSLLFETYGNQCGDMLLQPDGQIVLAGSSAGDLALARFSPDGSLDISFDLDGKVVTDITVMSEGARSVAIQPDGMIVVGGFGWDGISGDQFILARYTTAGELDPSFGGRGWVTGNLSTLGDQILALVLQKDSKILVAGVSQDPNDEDFDFALARYNPDGSLDTSFDGDGWLTTDFYGLDDYATSLLLQPDGKIVVAGHADVPGNAADIALVRYNPDGSLDASFGAAGKVVTDSGIQKEDFGFSVALQRDGKLIVSGGVTRYAGIDFVHRFALLRYSPEGSLDASFDGDGLVITEFYDSYEYAFDVKVQPNGRILAAGWVNGEGDTDFALARYLPDGSLDASFDGDGKLTTDFGDQDNLGWDVALQPDGRMLVTGYTDQSSDGESACLLARYNVDGSLDSSFSENGWLRAENYGLYDDECYAMALQPDGKIVLAGDRNGDFLLMRFE
jgi:uncharacterized delta-60 repeat protein